MNLISLILLGCLSTALVGEKAWAGASGAGNGGDGVYCAGNAGRPELQLLDFYELSIFEKDTPDLGSSGDVAAQVRSVIDWIKPLSPLRAERYAKDLQLFFSRVTWVQSDLQDIPDSQHVILPRGCSIRQLAIQERIDGTPRYTIDERLWKRLSPVDQAGLVLHEIVYGEALEASHGNSIFTREFVRFLAGSRRKEINTSPAGKRIAYFARAVIHSRLIQWVEYPFENGDVALFEPNTPLDWEKPWRIAGPPPAEKVLFWSARICGLKGRNSFYLNRCLEPATAENRFQLVAYHRVRIEKAKTSSAYPFYLRPPLEVNLTMDVLDYDLSLLRPMFIPKNDVELKRSSTGSKIKCRGGYPVYMPRQKDRQEYFDLENAGVDECTPF